MSEKTDVLIIGAGPTGLMLACQLRRQNVRVRIVDGNPGPSLQTKALGVQARTLEIYGHLGIAERALEFGKRATAASMWVQGRRVARVPLGNIGADLSPYPFVLILGQDDNEKLLAEVLHEHGTQVEWNTRLVNLVQGADGVTAKLERIDGSALEIEASWLAGCDGPRSTVRGLCQIPFEGAPYQHVFYVADTRASGAMTPGELNVYLWRGGFHLFFPLRGEDHWRVVGILPQKLEVARETGALGFDAVAPFVREEVGIGLAFHDCSWFSTYHVHHRCAARFRVHRCFLLGDAAHIHSPVGAQGMNTGLQDAYNLAWKLALVLAGHARENLLDSYEKERLPVAKRLLATTDRAFTFLISTGWLAQIFRLRVFQRLIALVMHGEFTRNLAFRTVSQIGIQYRSSPLSHRQPGLPELAPQPGDRFPWLRLKLAPGGPVQDLFEQLGDTCFNLLLFGQPLPADGAPFDRGGGRTWVIPNQPFNEQVLARAGIPLPSFYLLRPDGHIGFAGLEFDRLGLENYIAAAISGLGLPREVTTPR